VTEFNFLTSVRATEPRRPAGDAEEEAKARTIVDYYRVCFATRRRRHPDVGFWEGATGSRSVRSTGVTGRCRPRKPIATSYLRVVDSLARKDRRERPL
jgi:hypothetical protein